MDRNGLKRSALVQGVGLRWSVAVVTRSGGFPVMATILQWAVYLPPYISPVRRSPALQSPFTLQLASLHKHSERVPTVCQYKSPLPPSPPPPPPHSAFLRPARLPSVSCLQTQQGPGLGIETRGSAARQTEVWHGRERDSLAVDSEWRQTDR